MNSYLATIYTNDFAPVDDHQLKAKTMDLAADQLEEWMDGNGYPLHRFSYEISQIAGIREPFLMPV